MIKLEKSNPPAFLTPEIVAELTQVYIESVEAKNNGKVKAEKAVWRDADGQIQAALLEESYSKCVYCEAKVNTASARICVEHFLPKSQFQELVITWSNLLSACDRCNELC